MCLSKGQLNAIKMVGAGGLDVNVQHLEKEPNSWYSFYSRSPMASTHGQVAVHSDSHHFVFLFVNNAICSYKLLCDSKNNRTLESLILASGLHASKPCSRSSTVSPPQLLDTKSKVKSVFFQNKLEMAASEYWISWICCSNPLA